MNEREQKIAAKLNDADAAKQHSEQQALIHENKIQELEQVREKLVAEAKHDVQKWRDEQIQTARTDVEKTRKEWFAGLQREQEAFIQELQRRTADHAYDTARKILSELADVKLEEQVITVFLQKLKQLTPSAKQEIEKFLQESDDGGAIVTAFALSATQQTKITDAVKETFSVDTDYEFRFRPESLCGIELMVPGRKLSWTVNEALETLQEDLSGLLQIGFASVNYQDAPLDHQTEFGIATQS